MIKIAPKSSKIANAKRKTFNEVGTLLPKRAKTPIAKAISVAIGIPNPDEYSLPPLKPI